MSSVSSAFIRLTRGLGSDEDIAVARVLAVVATSYIVNISNCATGST
jgi:hypothetical protein